MAQANSINDIMNLINKKLTTDDPMGKNNSLTHAEGDLRFWVFEGPVLSDLNDLRDALRSINDIQYSYHVNQDKNDFAQWVEDVLHESELGRKLRNYRSRKSALKMIEVYLRKNYDI